MGHDQDALEALEGYELSELPVGTKVGVEIISVETPPVVPGIPPDRIGQWVQKVESLGYTVLENWPDPTKPETKMTVTLEQLAGVVKPQLNVKIHQGE